MTKPIVANPILDGVPIALTNARGPGILNTRPGHAMSAPSAKVWVGTSRLFLSRMGRGRDLSAWYQGRPDAAALRARVPGHRAELHLVPDATRRGGRAPTRPWCQPNFLFCAKLTRTLTHEVDAKAWQDEAAKYRLGIAPLVQSRQLIAILIQFGASFDRSTKHRAYLGALLTELAGPSSRGRVSQRRVGERQGFRRARTATGCLGHGGRTGAARPVSVPRRGDQPPSFSMFASTAATPSAGVRARWRRSSITTIPTTS
jgi:hypothetical protein